MKREIYLASFVVITVCDSTQGQALEIIDAIGGSLLPKVVQGIKEIRESGNRNTVKVDRVEFNKEVKNLSDYIGGITTALSNDAKSLKTIGDLSSSGARLYDDLGAMETMAQQNLISKIIGCQSDDVKRAYTYSFFRDLRQFETDVTGLQTEISSLTIDPNLKDLLIQKVDAIRSDSKDLQSFLATSGVPIPNDSSTPIQINSYLSKISDSDSNLSSLKTSVQDMLSVLSSRLGTFVNNAASVKANVDVKLKEMSENQN